MVCGRAMLLPQLAFTDGCPSLNVLHDAHQRLLRFSFNIKSYNTWSLAFYFSCQVLQQKECSFLSDVSLFCPLEVPKCKSYFSI